MDFFLLLLIALAIAFISSIVGAGGGFLIVPLLLLTTDLSPQAVAGTSLFVVLAGSLSATLAYRRQRNIDYRLGTIFILAGIPATFLGYYVNQHMSLDGFSIFFGIVMLMSGVLMLRHRTFDFPHYLPRPILIHRRIKDCRGKVYNYMVSARRAAMLAFGAAFISPLVGVGGGVLKVPSMVMFLHVPPKIAAATGQFLTFSLALLSVALFAGSGQIAWSYALPLAIGVIGGAQLGAAFSKRTNTSVVVDFMASAFLFVGVWMIINTFI